MSPKSQDIKQLGLFGFLAQPDVPTKSGVVILPTIFGVNAFVRGYAETLARAGLAAAVWDPYEGLPLITDYEESKTRSRKCAGIPRTSPAPEGRHIGQHPPRRRAGVEVLAARRSSLAGRCSTSRGASGGKRTT